MGVTKSFLRQQNKLWVAQRLRLLFLTTNLQTTNNAISENFQKQSSFGNFFAQTGEKKKKDNMHMFEGAVFTYSQF